MSAKIKMETSGGISLATARRTPLLNNALRLFMAAMVLANISSHMYAPLLPLYLKSLDANVVQVGLFFTLAEIIPLILQILGGWISDSLGRLRSIAMGSLAGVLGYIGMILAPTWAWVLLGEGFGAITRSLVAPSFGAFIAENSTNETRARVFGITETIFMVVSVIGPPLGGWLVDRYGFKFMLVCAAILYTTATIIRISMARNPAFARRTSAQSLSLLSLRANLGTMFGLLLGGGLVTWLLLADGVRDVAYALSFNLLPVYMQDVGSISIQQIGWLQSIFGLAMMLVAMPAGWLADKKGERVGIALGFGLQFAALMVFIRVSGFWGYGAAWALLGVGMGFMSPAFFSLTSKAVPERLRGTAFGLFSTSLGLISLPAPAIGAQLWERFSPRSPFALSAWASLLAVVPVWLKFRNIENHPEERPGQE